MLYVPCGMTPMAAQSRGVDIGKTRLSPFLSCRRKTHGRAGAYGKRGRKIGEEDRAERKIRKRGGELKRHKKDSEFSRGDTEHVNIV